MNNLFFIILNFNNQKGILHCLKSLIKSYPKANIIVVDNASTDNSLEPIISLNHRYMQIIKNKTNLGFAGGINKGLKLALKRGAQNILLLNPDTLPNKGFLKPMLANKAGIVGPILKFKRKGDWIYDFGGKVNFLTGRTSHYEYQTPNIKNFKQPSYVSGACMLIRKNVFEKLGLLNEKYFLFFEDADFCLKAKKAGFKIALESKSIMIHNLSEGKNKPLKCYYHLIRSNLIFINTWIPFYRRAVAYTYLWFLAFKMLLNRL